MQPSPDDIERKSRDRINGMIDNISDPENEEGYDQSELMAENMIADNLMADPSRPNFSRKMNEMFYPNKNNLDSSAQLLHQDFQDSSLEQRDLDRLIDLSSIKDLKDLEQL